MSNKTIKLNKRLEELPMDHLLMREIHLAQNIQAKLLNANPVTFSTGEIVGTSIPARKVGGDYFDFIELPNGRLRMIIGDVMGKGIPAAMLMILTRGAFRSLAIKAEGPGETLTIMNQALIEDLRALRSFVTLFCADWDPAARTLYFANAGHTAPFFKKEGGLWDRLNSKGIMIGGLPDQVYQELSIQFEKDSIVLFYTDGITESVNEAGEQFGQERFLAELNHLNPESAEDLLEMILEKVEDHTRGQAQKDDLTLLVLNIRN
jgi:phosphoserine phosphatase RsbU/P